ITAGGKALNLRLDVLPTGQDIQYFWPAHVQEVVAANGAVTTTLTDDDGRTRAVADVKGKVTRYGYYSGTGDPARVLDQDEVVQEWVRAEYTVEGYTRLRLVKSIDARGNPTEYGY